MVQAVSSFSLRAIYGVSNPDKLKHLPRA